MLATFTIRDLREKTGDLVRTAEVGSLSLITKHGDPVFLAVPFSAALLDKGVLPFVAMKLFQEKVLGLNRAAKASGLTIEEFMDFLGAHKVPVIDMTKEELDYEFRDLGVA